MTTTFLHEDKAIPPDERVDTDPPTCERCAQTLWLCRVETSINADGLTRRSQYECKVCGTSRVITTNRDLRLT